MKRGFTLVELSIVLVIIGLLIGGILAAQSMTETAKINTEVRRIQQFDVLFNNFQNKYNGIPGDSTKLGSMASDNDGTIESLNNSVTNDYNGEISNFWYFMTLSTQDPYNPGEAPDDTYLASANFIADSKLKEAPHAGYYPYGVAAVNYYFLSSVLEQDTDVTFSPGVKPITALALDKKMDDGIATSGQVQAYSDSDGTAPSSGTSGNAGCVITGDPGAYNTAYKNVACSLRINMPD